MSIVVDPGSFTRQWLEELRRLMPDETFVTNRDHYDPEEVEFVVNWKHPAEKILSYTNLKGVVLGSAGFDHVDQRVRDRVPVVRLIDPAMAKDIAHYCLSWIIHFQRDFDVFARQQAEANWTKLKQNFPRDYTVGVLGSGAIGSVILETLQSQGFNAIGWSRSRHDRPIEQFFGDADTVVNMLPNTAETHHLVSTELLGALGDGVLVNVGRGPTVDSDALLAALDGELRAAVLDVFDTEPLPSHSPLWRHPKIWITPHVAGRTDPTTAAPVVARNIGMLRCGEMPDGLV